MTWMVHLTGDTADLAAVARSSADLDFNVAYDGQDYVLTSDLFQASDDARNIRKSAEKFVSILNGALRVHLNATQPVCVGTVYRRRSDGTRDLFLFPEPAVLRLRGLPATLTVTRADGTIRECHSGDPLALWVRLALSDDSVDKVLRLNSSDTLDWGNLYRIFEVIQKDVGGMGRIALNGWATKRSMRLFKHTANSPGALGFDARHGVDTAKPPSIAMTIAEARSLVNGLVRAWLRAKTESG